jgi:hypothetical protein
MGLCNTGLSIFLKNISSLNIESSCSIGRQELRSSQKELSTLLNANSIHLQSDYNFKYLDQLLRELNCKKFDSIDYSDFEGATLIHDFNLPLSTKLYYDYDFVFDGGSLEHIFNISEAIKNSMLLVKPGGHYIGIHPCNNQSGHGFYQISPEFYFRVFTEENGFKIKKLYAYKAKSRNNVIYEIDDPNNVKSRVSIISLGPVNLFVLAERINKNIPFKTYPVQSDYAALWSKFVTTKNSTIKFNYSWFFNLFLNKIKKYFPLYINPQNACKRKKL